MWSRSKLKSSRRLHRVSMLSAYWRSVAAASRILSPRVPMCLPLSDSERIVSREFPHVKTILMGIDDLWRPDCICKERASQRCEAGEATLCQLWHNVGRFATTPIEL